MPSGRSRNSELTREHHSSIERAVPGEAAILTNIAHAAKRHWGYPDAWIQAWKEDLTLDQEYIRVQLVFTVRDPQPIGFYAIIPLEHEERWDLDHMWVHPSAMGHGHGRALLHHAADQARKVGARGLRILSDPHAESFYLCMGATRVGRVEASIDGVERWLPEMDLHLG